MVSEKSELAGVVKTQENRWEYLDWKIHRLQSGHFECVRIRPTRFFIATSLESAVKSIERREGKQNALSILQQFSRINS